MKTRTSVLYTSLLIIGIIILVNFLSSGFFFRLDLTADKRYTLSDATKEVLRSLDEPVTVKAYFSKKLPPQFANLRRDFKDMLIEYQNISHGNVVYEFIDPMEGDEDERAEKEREIQQKGILQAQIPGREKDEFKIQKAYLGAEIQMGEESEVISIIQSNEGMEYFLTTSIKKLSLKEKPDIGIIRGHGEPPLAQLQQVMFGLNVLYNVEEVELTDSSTYTDIAKYKALAMVAPTDSIPPQHLQLLDQHLANGKGLFVAINRVDADLSSQQYGNTINTGLETWLGNHGVDVNANFVMDNNCVPIGVQRQAMTPFGPAMVTEQVNFPYFPIVNNFADHPITSGLEQIIFQFVSSVNFSGDSTLVYTPLIQSSEYSGTQASPVYFNVMKEWSENDFPISGLNLAAAIEGKIEGDISSKMVVVADGDFPLGAERQRVNQDNINLMVNSIDWLSDDTGLIDLRTKGATARPLDEELSDGKRAFLKYFNFFLPIIIVILIGIIRFEIRRNKRIKRMEVNYV